MRKQNTPPFPARGQGLAAPHAELWFEIGIYLLVITSVVNVIFSALTYSDSKKPRTIIHQFELKEKSYGTTTEKKEKNDNLKYENTYNRVGPDNDNRFN